MAITVRRGVVRYHWKHLQLVSVSLPVWTPQRPKGADDEDPQRRQAHRRALMPRNIELAIRVGGPPMFNRKSEEGSNAAQARTLTSVRRDSAGTVHLKLPGMSISAGVDHFPRIGYTRSGRFVRASGDDVDLKITGAAELARQRPKWFRAAVMISAAETGFRSTNAAPVPRMPSGEAPVTNIIGMPLSWSIPTTESVLSPLSK